MKLWQAILLTVAIVVILLLLPKNLINPVATLIISISAIWVYKDAQKLNTKQYKSNLGMSPLSLAFWTLLLWVIFFPGYLWLRFRIKNNLVVLRGK